jgi:hypothetical protein
MALEILFSLKPLDLAKVLRLSSIDFEGLGNGIG